jgi:hypothetical protein
MRIYLEFFEILSEGSTEEPGTIRIDVTDWIKADVDTAIVLLKEHAQNYNHHVLQIHYCYHDESKPCSVVVIESA